MSSEDPYVRNKFSFNAYKEKTEVTGRVVAVLRGTLQGRNLELIPQPSRAIRRGDVHELILTDEAASPGKKVGDVAYVAFVEFQNGGVLLKDDILAFQGEQIGRLAGFDLSHFPNHMNIVFRGELKSGEDIGLYLGSEVTIRMDASSSIG